MYNGIGLQTPRGSGTNGYIQTNRFFVKPRSTTGPGGPPKPSDLPSGPGGIRKPNKELLDHDRRRKVEVRLLVLREKLEEQGYGEEEIEEKIGEARRAIELEMERDEKAADLMPPPASQRFTDNQTHQIAARKEKQMETLRAALGITLKEPLDTEDKKLEVESDTESGELISEKDSKQKDGKNFDGQLDSSLKDGGTKRMVKETKKHGDISNREKKPTDDGKKQRENALKARHVDYSDSDTESDSVPPSRRHKETKKGRGKHDHEDSQSDSDVQAKSDKKVKADITRSRRKRNDTDSDIDEDVSRDKKRPKTSRRHDSSESDDSSGDNQKRSRTSTKVFPKTAEDKRGKKHTLDDRKHESKRHDPSDSNNDMRTRKGSNDDKNLQYRKGSNDDKHLQSSNKQDRHDSHNEKNLGTNSKNLRVQSGKSAKEKTAAEERKRSRHDTDDESSDSDDSRTDDSSVYSSSDTDDSIDIREKRMAKNGNLKGVTGVKDCQNSKVARSSHDDVTRRASEVRSKVGTRGSGSSEYTESGSDSDDVSRGFEKREVSRDAKILKGTKTVKQDIPADKGSRHNVGKLEATKKDVDIRVNDKVAKHGSVDAMEDERRLREAALQAKAKRKAAEDDTREPSGSRDVRERNDEPVISKDEKMARGLNARAISKEEISREYKRARYDEPRHHSGRERLDEPQHYSRNRDDQHYSRRDKDRQDELEHHSRKDRDELQNHSRRDRDSERRHHSSRDRDDEPRHYDDRDKIDEPRSHSRREQDHDTRSRFGRERDEPLPHYERERYDDRRR